MNNWKLFGKASKLPFLFLSCLFLPTCRCDSTFPEKDAEAHVCEVCWVWASWSLMETRKRWGLRDVALNPTANSTPHTPSWNGSLLSSQKPLSVPFSCEISVYFLHGFHPRHGRVWTLDHKMGLRSVGTKRDGNDVTGGLWCPNEAGLLFYLMASYYPG